MCLLAYFNYFSTIVKITNNDTPKSLRLVMENRKVKLRERADILNISFGSAYVTGKVDFPVRVDSAQVKSTLTGFFSKSRLQVKSDEF